MWRGDFIVNFIIGCKVKVFRLVWMYVDDMEVSFGFVFMLELWVGVNLVLDFLVFGCCCVIFLFYNNYFNGFFLFCGFVF